jgi:chitinase
MRLYSALFLLVLTQCVYGTERTGPWVTAYYAGWMQGNQWSHHLTPQEIDFTAITHVVHFSLLPNPDGSLNDQGNGLDAGNATAVTAAAHAAGKKALVCVGGWNTEEGFASATSPSTRGAFIRNLIDLVRNRHYDGVDIDWEPVSPSHHEQYVQFIGELRRALTAQNHDLLLTVACMGEPALFGRIHTLVDQVNIMTYDFSGAWPGWLTWHNSAVYDGGTRFPSTGAPLPSIHDRVLSFLAAGIPAAKLGVGIDFYGYVWNGGSGTPTGGVTGPRQSWDAAPWVKDNVAYFNIMDSLYRPQYYRWDTAAQAAYLSIDNSGSANDRFVSYDDENSCRAKIAYVRQYGLGGVIIWELGGGWRPSSAPHDPLLQAVRGAVLERSPSAANPATRKER